MKIKELINLFNQQLNPDLVLFNEQDNEFILAVDVDCSSIQAYERDVLNSYPDFVTSNLKTRLNDYINKTYFFYKLIYEKQNFYVEKIPNLNDDNYRRIFYHATYEKLESFIEKKQSKAKIGVLEERALSVLNFNPDEKEKKTTILKNVGDLDDFSDWYVTVIETDQIFNSEKKALNQILKNLGKKGSWILESDAIKDKSKQTLADVIIEPPTKQSFSLSLFGLQDQITNFFIEQQNYDSADNLTKTQFLFDENTLTNKICIFYKFYKDDKNTPCFLYAFPKTLIDKFPNISDAIDLKKLETELTVTFDNFDDITKSHKDLQSLVNKRVQTLNDDGFSISNLDINFYMKDANSFISSLSDSFNEQKIEKNKSITFQYTKNKCVKAQPTNIKEVDDSNNAVYKICLDELVDGQTNLVLRSVKTNNVSVALPKHNIDNKISSYLFANSKKIVSSADLYTGKNFFTKLIYEKTKFEKIEGLSFSTFMTTAQNSFQQSFVVDATNIVKFSKIKANIENRFANKSIYRIIKDVLSDINSLKQLYEVILYRYEIKDLMDSLVKCYLQKNPELNELAADALAAKKFIEELVKKLSVNDPDIIKFVECTGVPIPLNFGGITIPEEGLPPPSEVSFNPEEFKDYVVKNIIQTYEKAANLDYISTTLIKCVDTYYRDKDGTEEIFTLIDVYIQNESIRRALKEQYRQLVLQAKLYKSNPGTKDAIKKKEKSFLSQAKRNAWTLLQRQIVIEAERIIKDFTIEYLKKLLEGANDCAKDEGKTKAAVSTGSLPIGANTSNQDINKLLNQLSNLFTPEQLCSLFNGTSDDNLYEIVLQIIRTNYPKLYSESPIRIENILLSNNPLSTVLSVKTFFFNLSVEKPEFKQKCDKYFQDILNNPVTVSDDKKCIDFSQDYYDNKIKDLTNRGFTRQQAEKIVENEKKLQTNKYKELQNTLDKGVYNEITEKEENTVIPAPDFVKSKINSQIKNLINAFSSLIDSYKNELLQISKNFLLKNKNVVASYDFNLNILNVNDESILFKQVDDTNFFLTVEPIFYYDKKYQFINFDIIIKSDNYDQYENFLSANLKQKMKNLFENAAIKNDIQTQLFLFSLPESVLSDQDFFTRPFLRSVEFYSKEIEKEYIAQIEKFMSEKFNEEKMFNDVIELIYFEE